MFPLALLVGCAGELLTGVATEPPQGFDWGDPVVCDAPVTGIDRFAEQSLTRGLTEVLPSTDEIYDVVLTGRGGALAVEDLDADGDLDILAGGFDGAPSLYENLGSGSFALVEDAIRFKLFGSASLEAITVGDLTGDGLPDVVMPMMNRFIVFENLGGLTFDAGTSVSGAQRDERRSFLTATLGDADGDGDLDLALPTIGTPSEALLEEAGEGDPDPLMLWEDGTFVHHVDLAATDEASRCRAATFTDRDRDGDADLFVVSDSGPASAFWRNDGPDLEGAPRLVDDAPELDADLVMAAMGIDSWDFNEDGLLDYCISDVGPPRCIQSEADGGYVQISKSLQLEPAEPISSRWPTVGWSIDLADLDNDGLIDLAQASGPEHGSYAAGIVEFPDLLWRGRADGTFEDVTDVAGFGDLASHSGLATADVDGNGWLDIVVVGPGVRPHLWMNRCGEASWLEVELEGAAPNTTAIGAVVEVEVDGRVQVREVMSLRGPGQSPSRLHFGLGEAEYVDRLRIDWPDGSVSEAEGVPANRLVTAIQ